MIDIFISFKNTSNGEKTKDAAAAQKLYDKLSEMKFSVFMMNDTLQKRGVSNYKKIIDQALDEAKCIIIIGSNREFLESQWVRFEWDTFLGEVLAGRKQDNIYTYRIGDYSIADLPISLRKYQSFEEKEELKLLMFVDNALSPQAEIEYDGSKDFFYPAVFSKAEDGEGYNVLFPDLELSTDGSFMEEAYIFAQAMLEAYFSYTLKYSYEFIQPSDFEKVKATYPNDIVMIVRGRVTPAMIKAVHAVREK